MSSEKEATFRKSLQTSNRILMPGFSRPLYSSSSPIDGEPAASLPRLKYIDGWKPQHRISMLCSAFRMASNTAAKAVSPFTSGRYVASAGLYSVRCTNHGDVSVALRVQESASGVVALCCFMVRRPYQG